MPAAPSALPSCRSARRSRSTPSSLSRTPDLNRRVAWLTRQPFAHRGLHGNGLIENSRAAFRAAIAAGHGIELDVQAARDGTPFVFHDEDLKRLAEGDGRIDRSDRGALSRIRLRGIEETIPTLEEVLALVAGRVPILVELKSTSRRYRRLCRSVHTAIIGYRGPIAVMSFDPRMIRWFAQHAPNIVRGIVISEEGRRNFMGLSRRRLALMVSKPDFLAYDIRSLPSTFAARMRARQMPILTWTVSSEASRANASRHADQIIYERFD
jgi:glycerophosphoryl diester phosphodiesterase